MSLNTNDATGGGGFRQPPLDAGAYPAYISRIVDLGVQPQEYNGEAKPPKGMLNISYEFADEFMVDEDGNTLEDKPRYLSESFTINNLKAERAKSTARYLALDPKKEHGGDFAPLVGMPVMLTVTYSPSKKDPEVIYNNVSSVTAMRPKQAAALDPMKAEPVTFDIDDPDIKVFRSLPDWMQDKIKENINFDGSVLEQRLEDYVPDEEEGSAEPEGEVEKDGEDW